MQRPWVPAVFLLLLLVAFRVLGAAYSTTFPNFQPLPALFLCSVIFLQGRRSWLVPMIAWVLSVPLANTLQGFPPFSAASGTFLAIGALLLTGLLALPFRHRSPRLPALLGLGLAAALVFHLVTILPIWALDPAYEKSPQGLGQALWSGRPHDLFPTWVFLRNLAVANVTFCLLFALALRNALRSPVPSGTLAQTR